MAPFHVTHHLEFLHQSFLADPWDAFGLRRLTGWWDQHLIRAFSQGNLMISKQMIQTGSVEPGHVLVQGEDSQSWDVHGKWSCQGGWESVERCGCVEKGRSSALCVRQPPDTASWDFWCASHWERCLVFRDTMAAEVVMRIPCWELWWISPAAFKSLWCIPSAKWPFVCMGLFGFTFSVSQLQD